MTTIPATNRTRCPHCRRYFYTGFKRGDVTECIHCGGAMVVRVYPRTKRRKES
jgi:rRNA maturation endonuclease Nob1